MCETALLPIYICCSALFFLGDLGLSWKGVSDNLKGFGNRLACRCFEVSKIYGESRKGGQLSTSQLKEQPTWANKQSQNPVLWARVRLYTWNWLACTRDTSSCSVDLCGWCREWYVELWRCVAGAAPVWHLVAGAVDWSILVALERGFGWLVQGRVRCSVTLWRNTSVTFGGRRSRLKHPGSVGVWVWVAGAGNTLHVRCSVTLRGRRSTSATFGGRWLKHPGSVGAWLWVAGAGKGTLQCDVVWQAQHQCDIWWQAQSVEVPGSVGAWLWWLVQGMVRCSMTLRGRRSTIWWQAQLPLYNLVPRNISVQQTRECA